MAFNWKTFQTRTLTAIIFAAVMLIGLLWNYWSFFILVSIIHFGCWWEYLKLAEKIHQTTINKAIKGLFIFSGFVLMISLSPENPTINTSIEKGGMIINLKWFVCVLTFLSLLFVLFENKRVSVGAKWMCLGGFFYISLTWGLMMNLRMVGVSISCTNGGGMAGADTLYDHFIFPFVIIPLTIISSIWINDTIAYIVGSLIGKTPLSKVSPKKTWEGTIGGIILSVIVTGLIFSNLNPEIVIRSFEYDFSEKHYYIIAAIAAIAGTFGDLLESKLKRMAGVKDSGNIMPGHGGFLDRFDSLLLAIPAVWLYIFLLHMIRLIF